MPLLPVAWTIFAVSAVGAFLVLAAYWLDVQDRPDLSFRARVGWSVAIVAFPLTVPLYAFLGGPGWPLFLRAASLLPAVAVALLVAFFLGAFT
jgi:hypothetical protein